MPLRTAGGPSQHYQKLCEDTTGHHGPFCAHTAAERRPHDWGSPSPTQSPHFPHSPLDVHDRSGLDDWERSLEEGGSTGGSTGSTVTVGVGEHGFPEPHPGQKRGESCINEEYVEELAKEESKTIKVLGFESDSIHGSPSAHTPRQRQLSRPTTPDKQEEDLRKGDRILKAVKGKLEWNLLGEQAKGVFDEVFWRRRRETDEGRRETDGERRKRGGRREHDRWLMRREEVDRRYGVENERREMRERWKTGMIEEAENAGKRAVK